MTYLVIEACIRCKYQDCIEVCPVDCFYVGENMLVIHPDECIDCGVCEPECPVEAIIPDTAGDDDSDRWLEINRKFAEIWPNITRKGDPPDDADDYKDEEGKFSKYFSDKPGEGGLIEQAGRWKLRPGCAILILLAAGRPAPGPMRRPAERPPLA